MLNMFVKALPFTMSIQAVKVASKCLGITKKFCLTLPVSIVSPAQQTKGRLFSLQRPKRMKSDNELVVFTKDQGVN